MAIEFFEYTRNIRFVIPAPSAGAAHETLTKLEDAARKAVLAEGSKAGSPALVCSLTGNGKPTVLPVIESTLDRVSNQRQLFEQQQEDDDGGED